MLASTETSRSSSDDWSRPNEGMVEIELDNQPRIGRWTVQGDTIRVRDERGREATSELGRLARFPDTMARHLLILLYRGR